ncbi:MAG: DUF507 family protein [bacterium]
MKLRKQHIEVIAAKIIDELLRREYIEVEDEGKSKLFIRKVIIEDLSIEDKLNEEVREILEKFSSEIRQGSVEYHKMYRLVKDKLIKERNLIL